MSDLLIDIGLYTAYVLVLGGAVLAFVIFPIVNIIRHPESLKVTLGAVVFMGAVFGISYLIASGETYPSIADEGYSYQQLKLMGAGMYSLLILLILTFASWIIGEIVNVFK